MHTDQKTLNVQLAVCAADMRVVLEGIAAGLMGKEDAKACIERFPRDTWEGERVEQAMRARVVLRDIATGNLAYSDDHREVGVYPDIVMKRQRYYIERSKEAAKVVEGLLGIGVAEKPGRL